jgi:hypothetical protein
MARAITSDQLSLRPSAQQNTSGRRPIDSAMIIAIWKFSGWAGCDSDQN